MFTRLYALLACVLTFLAVAAGKDKNKTSLPDSILRAQTVHVIVSPDTGQPLNHPTANLAARDAVENAIEAWGRFKIVHEGDADLVITVRTSTGQLVSPTIESGSTDTREGVQYGKVGVWATQGNGPALSDPRATPGTGPHVGKEIGKLQDVFEVYQGGMAYNDRMSPAPLWKYAAKDALKAPDMVAVREFRKAVAVAEKQQTKP